MRIEGVVHHESLETGFWKIITENGEEYIPVNMPEQLKIEGRRIQINGIEEKDMAGIPMQGIYIRILSFET